MWCCGMCLCLCAALESIFEQYRQWEHSIGNDSNNTPAEILKVYNQAQLLWKEREAYEQAIAPQAAKNNNKNNNNNGEGEDNESMKAQQPDYNSVQHWFTYIDWEQNQQQQPHQQQQQQPQQAPSQISSQRVISLYERAIKKFFLLPLLWRNYTDYLVRYCVYVACMCNVCRRYYHYHYTRYS